MANHPSPVVSSVAALVLVVEDDTPTREALQVLLEQDGFEVATAPDGGDALRQLRAGLQPSLILLDIMMPGKNGVQFRVEQVLDPRLEAIPVVAYSGDADAFSDSIRLGAVACLQKPIDPDHLLKIVRTHCQTSGR